MKALNFVSGLEVLRKYFTTRTKTVVIEHSTVSVDKLIRVTTDDHVYLQRIGWSVTFAQGPHDYCLAEYTLDYVDT